MSISVLLKLSPSRPGVLTTSGIKILADMKHANPYEGRMNVAMTVNANVPNNNIFNIFPS